MKDAIKMMENNMSPEAVRRAHIKAEQDIMTIRLAQLREEQNIKQSEMTNFTQSSVSKIEKRKDIKISTLIDYLDSLGMGLEIITYPKVALREFLANMMVHQDFDIKGMTLTVEIFANRLVFTNPGNSLNDVNRLIDLPPRSRNEKLAEMLLILNICERRGSGYDRAVEAIEAMNLPPYKVESGKNFTRLTLYPQKALRYMTQTEKIQACYQHACLLYEEGLELNNASLRKRLELDNKQSSVASRIISDTVNAGLIKVANEDIRSKKYATYIPYYG